MSKWARVKDTPPPAETSVLVSDGDYVGLAQMRVVEMRDGKTFIVWDVPGVGGYEWELGEPTHWQPIDLPDSPKENREI